MIKISWFPIFEFFARENIEYSLEETKIQHNIFCSCRNLPLQIQENALSLALSRRNRVMVISYIARIQFDNLYL